MTAVHILDCTLRDGGCVNDFCFGDDVAGQIYAGLKRVPGVSFVEVGYLDEQRGSATGRTQFDAIRSARRFTHSVLEGDEEGPASDLLMIDLGTCAVDSLPECDGSGFIGIRLAFHRNDLDRVPAAADAIVARGYRLFLQPMLTLRYDADDLARLFAVANAVVGLTAMYVVDSFGQMAEDDVSRLVTTFEAALDPGTGIGFHAHDNLGRALANSARFIDLASRSRRSYYVDGSLGGIGKGAGNAKVERLLSLLPGHEHRQGACQATDLAAAMIDPLRRRWQWGPSDSMAICARLNATPSYYAYFRDRGERPESELVDFLSAIAPEDRIAFSADVAERSYALVRAPVWPRNPVDP